jgi:membrane-bound serine protease (ClpP class)
MRANKLGRWVVLWVTVILAVLTVFQAPGVAVAQAAEPTTAAQAPVVVVLRLDGALHPVMLEHFKRASQQAERRGASAIVIELDTPGGEVGLMTSIYEAIRASEIPVIVFVGPRGAMAASAGTIITLAGHASGMAPETTIGAASPIGGSGENLESTSETKIKEVMKATVRNFTANRPPEAIKLAEETIESARAVSVDEALAVGLIDVKARDLNDLLAQLDGRVVQVRDEPVTLRLADAQVVDVPQTFMENALTVLANPNLVFLLLAIGVQAILIEFSSPGGWIAGFIGVVCLLLAVYGLGLLPVNWFGILFIATAFALFMLELQTPTIGGLTAAGVGAFIVGALVLFNSPNVPNFQRVSVPLVVGVGLGLGLIFFGLVGYALRSRNAPLRMGRQTMVGQVGVVNTPLAPSGTVQVGSELWSALLVDDGPPLPRGARVEVVATEANLIHVKRI